MPWREQLDHLLRRLRPGRKSARALGERGSRGEDLAAAFLRREKGFRQVCRNWRHGREEIDLVAWDGAVLVFVEVRARDAAALVPGYYTVNTAKRRVLLRACRAYLKGLRRAPEHIRFDIVEVRLGPGGEAAQINHYENVPLFPASFRPGGRRR